MAELVLPQSIDAGTPAVASEVQSNFIAIRDWANGNIEGGSGANGNIKADGITAREIADAELKAFTSVDALQEGVVAAGDLKVTPGAGLALNYATGVAHVKDDSGVIATNALIRINVTGSSVTIAANASGNPRIDQVVLTMTGWNTGTVSVLQGTASVGATLDNRTGAAALPSNAIRLADILMPNGFAGPFVQNTHIRDRRPWATGAHWVIQGDNAGSHQTTSITGIELTAYTTRLELSGGLIELSVSGVAANNTAGGQAIMVFKLDGAELGGANLARLAVTSPAGNETDAFMLQRFTVASPGSHVLSLWLLSDNVARTAILQNTAGQVPRVEFKEYIGSFAANDGA